MGGRLVIGRRDYKLLGINSSDIVRSTRQRPATQGLPIHMTWAWHLPWHPGIPTFVAARCKIRKWLSPYSACTSAVHSHLLQKDLVLFLVKMDIINPSSSGWRSNMWNNPKILRSNHPGYLSQRYPQVDSHRPQKNNNIFLVETI